MSTTPSDDPPVARLFGLPRLRASVALTPVIDRDDPAERRRRVEVYRRQVARTGRIRWGEVADESIHSDHG